MKSYRLAFVGVAGFVLGLAACSGGGGGGGDGSSSSSNTAPTITVSSDQVVSEGSVVQLSATVSDSDGDTVTVSWTQTSGPSVTLSDTTSLTPSFTAPQVDAIEVMAFTATASDGQATASQTSYVSVTDTTTDALIARFEVGAMAASPEVVSCTLSNGDRSACLSLTLASTPAASYTIGPWCPRHITDTAEQGGIWLENGVANDVDGAFIENLATFYNDSNWLMYDPTTGDINYTETADECDAAARPNVDPDLQNHCVECQKDFLAAGITENYLLPLAPVQVSGTTDLRNADGVGVAFSGILFDEAAPVQAILSAYTIAPFDDCGGHINPVVGYHIHAVTDDCLAEYVDEAGHANAIGIAMDGFTIYERIGPDGIEPTDLDECNGHTSAELGYHYHAGTAGSNAILPCFKGAVANN